VDNSLLLGSFSALPPINRSRYEAFFGVSIRLKRGLPLIDPAAHLVFFIAIAFFDLAGEFVVIALNLKQIVIGELTPLFLQFAFTLLPLPFELIAVHISSVSLSARRRGVMASMSLTVGMGAFALASGRVGVPTLVATEFLACWRLTRTFRMSALFLHVGTPVH
jgi:hypothetical protein